MSPAEIGAEPTWSVWSLPVMLTAIAVFALGLFFLQRSRTIVNRLFFLLSFAVTTWLASFAIAYSSADPVRAEVWIRIGYLGVALIPAAIYHFALSWIGRPERRQWLVLPGWFIGALFLSAAFGTDLLVREVVREPWGWYPRYGVLGVPFLLYFATFLGATFTECVREYRREQLVARREALRWLIVAFGVSFLGIVDFLPKFDIEIYPLGFIPILAFVAIVSHIVWKQRLADISPAIAAREIVDTMADGVLVCDANGVIRFANRAAVELFGYSETELVGSALEMLADPDSTFASVSRLRQSLRQGARRDLERTFITSSGEPVDVSIAVSPIDEGGSAESVVIVRDIREVKRQESEIKRHVSLLRSTLESTADGIVVLDLDDRVVTWNERFAQLWDLAPSLLGDAGLATLVDWIGERVADEHGFRTWIEELQAEPGLENTGTLELIDQRVFDCFSLPQRLEGNIVGRVWSFRDVTERHRSEDALRDSEERFRMLFERNLAGVFRERLDGTVLDCNDAFARMLGFEIADEMIGRKTSDYFYNPREREGILSLLRSAGSLSSFEISFRRQDGSRAWVLENVTLVAGDGESGPVLEGTIVDISDRKRAEEQIQFHASHDVLTCLPNRWLFSDLLNLALAHARRSKRLLAVLFFDLDHFKVINDTMGHTAGDELLVEVAERLSGALRDGDTVARLGGDEFTILLSDLAGPDDAARVAEKILAAIAEPLLVGGQEIFMTASIGIAIHPNDGDDPETLLQNADNALFKAKEAGRNNYQLCTAELKSRALERLVLESSVRLAVERNELRLHYQPFINLVSGQVSGMEALVRWQHPEKGMIQPAGFIPVAEHGATIVAVGNWVLREAVMQARKWLDAAMPMRVAVNISARHFLQRELVSTIGEMLNRFELPADLLELEITESTAMHNAEFTIETLSRLREMGVSISIDDFGTGYSSLNYLKQFPISCVKIDKSFIRDITTDAGDAAIVSAVVNMARSLGLRVIAEGVETNEQFAILRAKACEEIQGFLFSEPRPAEEFTPEFLSEIKALLFSAPVVDH